MSNLKQDSPHRRIADRLAGARAVRFVARQSELTLIKSALAADKPPFTVGRGVGRGARLMMFLSLLGVGFGANMWRLALASERDGRWWLSHHMNGAMLHFIATHDSFIALGIGSVVPELRASVPRRLVAAGVTGIGIILRVRSQRRHAQAVEMSQPGRDLVPSGGG